MKHIAILIISLNLKGCISWYAADYSSMEARHLGWVRNKKLCIGKHIDRCQDAAPDWPSTKRYFLPNNNMENAVFARDCYYSYEYDPKTGIIVDFRFEDLEFEQTKKNYGCRLTGA